MPYSKDKPFITGILQKLLLNKKMGAILDKSFEPADIVKNRKKIDGFVVDLQNKAASKRSPELDKSVTYFKQQRKILKKRLQALVESMPKRKPEDVILNFVSRLELQQKYAKKVVVPVRLIVRTQGIQLKSFKDIFAKQLGLSSQEDLSSIGVSIRVIKVGKSSNSVFSIQFNIEHKSVQTELLNFAWALRKNKQFESVSVSGLRGYLYAVPPSATTRAERNFAWHLDLTRTTSAHEISPPVGGRKLGDGVVIAHPDTGWAVHEQYNQEHIDQDRSFNVITSSIGGDNARHSLRNGDASSPNITHGTTTGSVILGGKYNDSEELSSTRPERTLNFATDYRGERQHLGINLPKVFDPRGHLTGVAPKSSVLPIKFISDNAFSEIPERGLQGIGVVRLFDEDLVNAIRYSIDSDADVISLSVGGLMHDEVRQVIDEAIISNNIIVVGAAGQTFAKNIVSELADFGARFGINSADSVVLPAAYTNVIAVAGCSTDGAPWKETHYGPNVDICAPADGVWVADYEPENDNLSEDATRRQRLNCGSGTSFSASFTAGAAALWIAHWGRENLINRYASDNIPLAWVFRHQLQQTANAAHANNWDDGRYGPGVINVEALLKHPLPEPNDVEPPPVMVEGIAPMVSGGVIRGRDIFYEIVDSVEGWGEQLIGCGSMLWERGSDEAIDFLSDLWARAESAVSEASGEVLEFVEDVKDAVTQTISDVVNAAEDAIEEVSEAADEVLDEAEEVVEEVVDTIGEAAEEVFDTLFGWI